MLPFCDVAHGQFQTYAAVEVTFESTPTKIYDLALMVVMLISLAGLPSTSGVKLFQGRAMHQSVVSSPQVLSMMPLCDIAHGQFKIYAAIEVTFESAPTEICDLALMVLMLISLVDLPSTTRVKLFQGRAMYQNAVGTPHVLSILPYCGIALDQVQIYAAVEVAFESTPTKSCDLELMVAMLNSYIGLASTVAVKLFRV